MSASDLFEPLLLLRGPAMKNRFMLAPLMNQQSRSDGGASGHDVEWVARVAQGGFALVQTCAATVQATGVAFHGQLGVHDDGHLDGLTAMADAVRGGGALSAVQLHYAGHRAQRDLGGVPAPASDGNAPGVPALSTAQVEHIRDDFIRAACRPDFQIGLRLSVERYGLWLEEVRDAVAEDMLRAEIDCLDLALWVARQRVREGAHEGRAVLGLFAELPRHGVRLGAAGKIMGGERAAELLEEGCDFVLIGRGAVLRPDFPRRVRHDPACTTPALPVSADYLRGGGISPLHRLHGDGLGWLRRPRRSRLTGWREAPDRVPTV